MRRLAGLFHISTFMAGATAKGHFRAATRLARRLSAMPWEILAIVLAVAGAMTNASASRVKLI